MKCQVKPAWVFGHFEIDACLICGPWTTLTGTICDLNTSLLNSISEYLLVQACSELVRCKQDPGHEAKTEPKHSFGVGVDSKLQVSSKDESCHHLFLYILTIY